MDVHRAALRLLRDQRHGLRQAQPQVEGVEVADAQPAVLHAALCSARLQDCKRINASCLQSDICETDTVYCMMQRVLDGEGSARRACYCASEQTFAAKKASTDIKKLGFTIMDAFSLVDCRLW